MKDDGFINVSSRGTIGQASLAPDPFGPSRMLQERIKADLEDALRNLDVARTDREYHMNHVRSLELVVEAHQRALSTFEQPDSNTKAAYVDRV